MLLQDIPNALEGTIIDVRTREEYELTHAADSVNIPWDLHLYYLKELEALPQPWILCCEEGWRAGWMTFSLRMLGFNEVYNAGRWFDMDKERNDLRKKMQLPTNG